MEDKCKELIIKSTGVFLQLGMKSVTMDDLARNLGVSKKTIYKCVEDKHDLIKKAVQLKLEHEKCEICEMRDGSTNAIDELFEVSKMVSANIRGVHPSIFYDMEKYYPEAWKALESHKHEFVFGCIRDNLVRGKKEGLYRSDLNEEVIGRTYVNHINDVFKPELFGNTELYMEDIYLEIFRYHIRGIASEEGVKYLVEKVKREQLN